MFAVLHGSAPFLNVVAGVGCIGKLIADDIEGHRNDAEDDGGQQHLIGMQGKGCAAMVYDIAQGDDILGGDAAHGRAQTAGSHVVFAVADGEDSVSEKAGFNNPAAGSHGDKEGKIAGVHDIGQQHQIDRGGNIGDDIIDFDHDGIQLFVIAPNSAYDHADTYIRKSDAEGKDEGIAHAISGAGPYIAAKGIRAEPMIRAGALIPGQREEGYLVGVDGRYDGIDKAHQDDCRNEDYQQQHGLVFEERAQGGLPIGIIGIANIFTVQMIKHGGAELQGLSTRLVFIFSISLRFLRKFDARVDCGYQQVAQEYADNREYGIHQHDNLNQVVILHACAGMRCAGFMPLYMFTSKLNHDIIFHIKIGFEGVCNGCG